MRGMRGSQGMRKKVPVSLSPSCFSTPGVFRGERVVHVCMCDGGTDHWRAGMAQVGPSQHSYASVGCRHSLGRAGPDRTRRAGQQRERLAGRWHDAHNRPRAAGRFQYCRRPHPRQPSWWLARHSEMTTVCTHPRLTRAGGTALAPPPPQLSRASPARVDGARTRQRSVSWDAGSHHGRSPPAWTCTGALD